MAALLVTTPGVRTADLLWGALSGVGSGVAMHFLNRGLSRGAMSGVVPALPVVLGLALLRDGSTGGRPWARSARRRPRLLLTTLGRAPGPRVRRTSPPHARRRAAGRGGRGWAPVRVRPTAQPHVAE
ncbi:hypothetical protein ACWGIV_26280 [Streptomyces sp. NPDC054844]